MALLEVRGLVKRFGSRTVVNGVSFEVNPGEVVGLLGPNGAGKTTSFRMSTGQISPNDGSVFFDGKDVTHLPMFRRARLGMGYLSQEQSIFRKLSVEQNLIAILEALPISRTLGRSLTRSERWERTEEALTRFNLLHVRKNNAARCSGGEKRRLEIARCLVCEPLLILLDEPFAAVDPLTTEDIRHNIRELANQGIGILLTDHNVREVLKITDRSYLIKDGKVVAHGTPEEVKRNPIAIREYLGNTFADDPIPLSVLMPNEVPTQYRSSVLPVPARIVPPAPSPEIVPPNAVFSLYLPSNAETDGDDEPPKPPTPNSGLPTTSKPTTILNPPMVSTTLHSPLATPIRDEETSAGQFSSSAQQMIDYEKMRRFVDQLKDKDNWSEAWHELAKRGLDALPVLLDALERRDLDTRHFSYRLLEQITGETLAFQADAPEETRMRQVAYLRAKWDRRKSA